MLASKFGYNAPVVQAQHAPLTDDQLRRVVPSVFAEDAHHSRSERYQQIPTIDVLNGLRREGFQPFFACQTRVRRADKRDFTKHMLRLRHVDARPGREVNEIILLNSHDGTSSYQMLAGCFRFVCQNGMVLGDKTADIRIRHKGDVVGNVIEGAYSVVENFDLIDAHKEEMQELILPPVAQRALAAAALEYRYGTTTEGEDGEPVLAPMPFTPEQVLRPRRMDDRADDLWTTFNRVQENMTKGGAVGCKRDSKGKIRRTRMRAVTGIDSDVKLNRALWTMAQQMKEML
jgi:hypothetical protein